MRAPSSDVYTAKARASHNGESFEEKRIFLREKTIRCMILASKIDLMQAQLMPSKIAWPGRGSTVLPWPNEVVSFAA